MVSLLTSAASIRELWDRRDVHWFLRIQNSGIVPVCPRILSNTPLVLHVEPLPLFRGNRVRLHAEQ